MELRGIWYGALLAMVVIAVFNIGKLDVYIWGLPDQLSPAYEEIVSESSI